MESYLLYNVEYIFKRPSRANLRSASKPDLIPGSSKTDRGIKIGDAPHFRMNDPGKVLHEPEAAALDCTMIGRSARQWSEGSCGARMESPRWFHGRCFTRLYFALFHEREKCAFRPSWGDGNHRANVGFYK